jgi:hypothetical protein
LAQAGRRQFAQVAPDAVLGHPELGRDVLRDHAPIPLEAVQQQLPTLRSQHARFSVFFLVFADYAGSLPDMAATKPLLILIAGPYRSGTGDDPERLDANLRRLEEAAWPIFAAGHLPMIGEWVALPVLRSAGADGVTDPLAEQVMYPTAQRLLQHCDAVLRLTGESTGADQDVAIAHRLKLPVYYDLADVPGVSANRTGGA